MIATAILAVVLIAAAQDQTFLGHLKGTQAPDYGSKELLLKYQKVGDGGLNFDLESDKFWRPMVTSGQPVNFNCWVSFLPETRFWSKMYSTNSGFDPKPVW